MGSITPAQKPIQTTQDPAKTLHDHRLLPHVLDQLAVADPDHVVGMIAKSTDISQGFSKLTAYQLSLAVNHMSHHIDHLLGKVPLSNTSLPIAFIGIQDFRYWVMEVAAMKTSHPLLLPSTANALPNTVSLLEATGTKALFYAGKGMVEEQALALQALVPGLEIYEIPTLEAMFKNPGPEYRYVKTFEEAKDDQVLIVHTSGSTGTPKPIYLTNKFLSRIDADALTPPVAGRRAANLALMGRKKLQYIATPFFHLSAIIFGFMTVLLQTTLVLGPTDATPTGKMAFEIAKAVRLSGFLTVPSLCDAIFADYGEELIPFLGDLEHVLWLGGPLAKSTGDWITTHTTATLWQIYGSTEVSLTPMLIPPKSHWQYFEFHPTVGPTLERLHPDSDLYEVVYHRHPNPAYAWSRPVFDIFPEHREWRSRDLFRRCEDEGFGDCWLFQGRVDDMMVMHSGAKVNPLHIEMKLQVHPSLKGCLVIGTGYTRCGLLLEPKDYGLEKEVLLTSVWPSVEAANAGVPEHARIDRRFIVVGTEDRPFVRAGKGTIVRKLTIGLYEKEIKEIYGSL